MVKILHSCFIMTFYTNKCLIYPPPSLVTTLKRCFHCPIDFCIWVSSNRDHFSSMTCFSSSVFRNGFLRPAYTSSFRAFHTCSSPEDLDRESLVARHHCG